LLSGFDRLADRRVDLRDGRVRELSSMYGAFFPAAFDPWRPVTASPGCAVPAALAGRGRRGFLGRLWLARSTS
jgi:hypothetical protein